MLASLLACALTRAAPQDSTGELVLSASAVAVSPAGELWVGTRDGRLFVSRDWNRSWSEVPLGPHTNAAGRPAGEELTNIRFFDAEQAIATGNLGLETKNEILRTADGGRTWTRVALGAPHGPTVSVEDVQVSPDGHAWLTSSTGVLASTDFGVSWSHLPDEPFEGAARGVTVAFRTPELGVVGADGNALARTADGGRTWSFLPTPVDALPGAEARALDERERRVQGVWFLGERLVVLQNRWLFQRPAEGEGAWNALVPMWRHEVVAAAFDDDRLLVVTGDLRLSWLSSSLEFYGASNASLEQDPCALACGARGAAFVTDPRGRVCTLEGLMLACARMEPGEGESRWPIIALDRAADGTLFGITTSALYRSRDSGRSWERIGGKPLYDLYDVLASADGSQVFVRATQNLLCWREGRGFETLPAEIAPSLGFKVEARRGSVWIATGFEAEGEVARAMLCSTDTVFAGPGFNALVLASADEGASWRRIAEHEGAVVEAAWLGNDDVLRLCLSDGTIRTGGIDPRDGALVGGELARLPEERRLGGEWGTWLAFSDSRNGWVGGNGFFRGTSLFRTNDGGQTWSSLQPTREVTRAFRLGGGATVRVVGFWQAESRVDLVREGEFREIRRFEPGANDARVDAAGRLLLRLTDGELWSLAADGGDWTRVGRIPVPAR